MTARPQKPPGLHFTGPVIFSEMAAKLYLSDEQFAQIYNAAPSRAEAARSLGMTFASMQGRAYKIHKAGVIPLKRFTWGKPGIMTWLAENHPDVLAQWKGVK